MSNIYVVSDALDSGVVKGYYSNTDKALFYCDPYLNEKDISELKGTIRDTDKCLLWKDSRQVTLMEITKHQMNKEIKY